MQKKNVVRKIFLPFFLLFPGITSNSLASENIIAKLRASGWQQVEKFEEVRRLNGQGQYKNLVRVIHVSHFVFVKNDQRKACWMSYDSQQDQIKEGCRGVDQ
ncbi:MAG: hypothetical protein CFH06_00092 [Alphaproteobacteria bacterium MarineAlpha3_Bin5]|nr:hypothetical protein [Magnetovibrio sp.]PPR80145.1 MAG: hypothetical protein CFH06_00092 [Alphaproteobacteria bacterium MarineAlpha3_Bin5]|tara:strand:+ start:346 stop:651 length:306 start_codon:yes stop_codon:yes gene_type:complete